MRIVLDMDYPEAARAIEGTMHFIRVHDSTFEEIRTLTDAEWATYSTALKVARNYHACDELLVASEANYDEFAQTFVELHRSELTTKAAEARAAHLAGALNRRLANYLSSMRLFLDVTEARLNREYGETSNEYGAFKDACRRRFDSHFSYRFAYRLRNFAQHLGMPIGHIRTAAIQREPSGLVEYVAEIAFKPRELLEDGKGMWGPVRQDLENAPALLPVVEVFGSFRHHLRVIRNETLVVERPHLERLRASVDELLNSVPRAPGVRQIGTYVNDGGRLAIEFVDSVSQLIGSLKLAAVSPDG